MPQLAGCQFLNSSRWRRLFRAAAIVAAALAPGLALAEVEWHADLETAHAASRISRRPVLAVFVADWGEAANSIEVACLDSAEAEAVLTTCFEPVRIDIDEHEDLTRAAGVTHVPTACVLAPDNAVLTSFQMSGRPARFVTNAILAAQRVAALEHDSVTSSDGEAAPGSTLRAASESVPAAGAFGSGDEAGLGLSRSPRGSMARVTAKVRDLSAFATGQGRPAATASPVTIAPAARSATEPRSDYAPLTWPAERATAPPTTPTAAPAIEPAATALKPTTASPWLDSATRPAPTEQAAAVPETPMQLPAPAQPQPAPAPRQSGLVAALQKPFGFLGKSAAEPPTMPPALPRNPFAFATPPAAPAAAEPVPPAATETATATTDVHGSMPLGLEGYCPVTLVDRGSWTEGRAQWGARHRGRTYLFAGPQEQQVFLADPDRYAPALSGDDPVLALDRHSSTPGQRRYGVTYQSRIYLFATPETRAAFTADPARYTNGVAIAERTPAAAGGTRLY